MAAGSTVAAAIPDRLYALAGRWLVSYWETEALQPGRFAALEWFATDLGTLSDATAFPAKTARAVVHAFVAELMSRGCDLPDDALSIADQWFESGRGRDPRPVLWEWREIGDPYHKPTLRPISGGAVQ